MVDHEVQADLEMQVVHHKHQVFAQLVGAVRYEMSGVRMMEEGSSSSHQLLG
jgi:hypothetical protein